MSEKMDFGTCIAQKIASCGKSKCKWLCSVENMPNELFFIRIIVEPKGSYTAEYISEDKSHSWFIAEGKTVEALVSGIILAFHGHTPKIIEDHTH